MVAAATLVGFASCGGDDNTDPENPKTPSIAFTTDGDYVANATVEEGEVFDIAAQLSSNSESGSELTKFTVVQTSNNVPATILDSTIKGKSVKIIVPVTAGTANFTLTFTLKDKAGESISKTLTFTVVPVSTGGEINSWTAKLLGAQNATAGSLFASVSGNVYKQSEANANAATIDITYGVLGTGGSSFISPDKRGTNGFTAITGATATAFAATTMTATEFAAITDDTEITAQTAPTADKVTSLENGKVYVFKNAAGKQGLIHISALTTGESGSVTIDVKVQK